MGVSDKKSSGILNVALGNTGAAIVLDASNSNNQD